MKEYADQFILRSKYFEQIISLCHNLLLYNDIAINEKRYITNRLSLANIDKFNIGYFPDNNHLDLLLDNVDNNILQELRLIYDKFIIVHDQVIYIKKSFFRYHNLIIPYQDEYGYFIGLSGRSILSSDTQKDLNIDKYKNTFFDKNLHLFGLNKAKRSIIKNDYVIIVEGQFDCMSCHSNGIHNVVALCGSSFSNFQFFLLKKLTNNIYLLLDNDDAGVKATKSIISRYSSHANITSISFPKEYHDIYDYLQTEPMYKILSI